MSDSKIVIVVFRWLYNKLRHTRIMTQNIQQSQLKNNKETEVTWILYLTIHLS